MADQLDYSYRNSMWTLFGAIAIGGFFQIAGAPDPIPAVVAGVTFVGIPLGALILALSSH